jgi:hypothetical protein
MSTRDVNLYGSFEDWFLANIDADSARDLREHGASCGIGGLCYYSETVELFNAFGNEIELLAIDDGDMELWEIAKASDACGITQLINALVWRAAERLAYNLESQLEEIEEDETECDQEDDNAESTFGNREGV